MAARSDPLPQRFARIPTAVVADVLDELGLERQVLPSGIRPLAPAMRAAGYAFTARGRARRTPMRERAASVRRLAKMLAAVPAGSILVVAASAPTVAAFGEPAAHWLRRRGARGAVIDGAARDAAALVRLGLPTFVRATSPQHAAPRWRVSDWGQPLTIGGVRIALGDLVVADVDGVVVVPRRAAHEALVRAEGRMRTIARARTALRRGAPPLAVWEEFAVF
jgi:regulator of RNase E activity RraA